MEKVNAWGEPSSRRPKLEPGRDPSDSHDLLSHPSLLPACLLRATRHGPSCQLIESLEPRYNPLFSRLRQRHRWVDVMLQAVDSQRTARESILLMANSQALDFFGGIGCLNESPYKTRTRSSENSMTSDVQ
ncbi:hypothetical protein MIND_00560400 [Mycena indigotica]|uniref:Uncharacterized protein n=1 Tax=Mycena indigotica TaxID=2126181 RepID=A0A8H6W947_9AGAR|nr:uncharacterized protein MIND_00560400 [Mycena indigotica]KAF7307651.1 hypothetical protein MIND_00560400 [Mycena indigotica]